MPETILGAENVLVSKALSPTHPGAYIVGPKTRVQMNTIYHMPRYLKAIHQVNK